SLRPLIYTPFPYTTLCRSIGTCHPRADPCVVVPKGLQCTERLLPTGPRHAPHGLPAVCRNGADVGFYVLLCSVIARLYHYVQLRSEEHTSELQSRENLVCR